MFPYVALLCPKVGLYCSKAESRVPGGGWWWVVVVQTNNHVKPNFRWIALGCFGVVLWLSCGFDNLKLTKSPYFLWKPNLTQWWTFKENSTQFNLTFGFWLWSSPACFNLFSIQKKFFQNLSSIISTIWHTVLTTHPPTHPNGKVYFVENRQALLF